MESESIFGEIDLIPVAIFPSTLILSGLIISLWEFGFLKFQNENSKYQLEIFGPQMGSIHTVFLEFYETKLSLDFSKEGFEDRLLIV